MKTIVKLLFAALAVVCLVNYAPQGDVIVQYMWFGIGSAVIAAAVVPPKYFNTGTLGVLDQTLWKKFIVEALRKNNAFMFRSKDDTRYVKGGLTVVIPNAGADPTVIVNNTSWPLTPVPRTDTDVSYTLDLFSTTPHYVTWAELQTISYDKWISVFNSHMNTLADKVADKMMINWAPTISGRQVATTGGSGATTQAAYNGQTGTRKIFHPDDLISVMTMFNQDDAPDAGRNLLVDANMYGPFYNALSASQANAYNQFADNKTGQVGKLHGFNVFVRSTALIYAAASATPKAFGSSVAATDNFAALAWHEDMVCRAVGNIEVFQNLKDPTYQGDIVSMAARLGGRKERGDNKGVVAVVQAA